MFLQPLCKSPGLKVWIVLYRNSFFFFFSIPFANYPFFLHQVLQNQQKNYPLYNGQPLTPKAYESWYMECITKLLILFRNFGSSLNDPVYFSKLRHRIFLNLINPKTYYIPTDVMALLDKLKAAKVPYGIVANSGPHFAKLLRGIDGRIKHGSYLTVAPGERKSRVSFAQRPHHPLIPFANAADTGLGKPDTSLFLDILRKVKPKNPDNVYYIGDDVDTDYAPSKSLGLKSVLVTRHFEKPVSDVKYLSAKECRRLPYMRVARISEIEKVLFEKQAKHLPSSANVRIDNGSVPGVSEPVSSYSPELLTQKEQKLNAEKSTRVLSES